MMNKLNLKTCLIAYFAILLVQACSPKYQLSGTNKQQYPIDQSLPKDSAILNYYSPYKRALDSIMNDVVAISDKEIRKAQPEGPLNNFFADAMYYSAKQKGIEFDFAYTNSGGLRTVLPKGNIYRYQIFELMPFENAFTTVTFKGKDTKEFFDFIARSGGDPISGARFIIDGEKAIDITINEESFNPNRTYTILTSDYMANGGDGGEIFTKAIAKKNYEYRLRDGLFDYLKYLKESGKTLNPVNDGRIKIK